MYWMIQCPHCVAINYYNVVNYPADSDIRRYRWPILRCRCGKYYSKLESSLARHLYCCEPIPHEEVSSLVLRQSSIVELETRS